MPPTLTIKKISTLKGFIDSIESRLRATQSSLWYRGCGEGSYNLIPSLFRHPDKTDINDLLVLESHLIGRFKQRSVPYQNRELRDDWENIFFMQHFGVPTRLLDWTENPYISLYFALTDAMKKNSTPKTDAAIWILDPIAWNRKALHHIGFSGEVLALGDPPLEAYKPLTSSSTNPNIMPSHPVALYGTHNSPRIVAQRGVFTIFGKDISPMEDIYISSDFPQDSLTKMIIPRAKIQSLLLSIISIGITDSVVFPDLDGLAKETKRFFGFNV